jgi:hypothetical protein
MPDRSRQRTLNKRLISGAFLLLLAFTFLQQRVFDNAPVETELAGLFQQQASKTWVEFEARVQRLLSDDQQGSRHQRFIVDHEGQTVLIAHNIDLAPRVPVKVGDAVFVRGRYEWNERGGVVHWTHHDPQNRRPGGWIEHRKKKFK